MYFDLNYLLLVVVPGVLLGLWAQATVKSAVARASQIRSRRGLTGAHVARAILAAEGIDDVQVEPTEGILTDHYHPMAKALRLSGAHYGGDSLAAVGIAAHEVGHALQHAQGYLPLQLRSALVPACVAGQWVGQLAMMFGALLMYASPALGQPILMLSIAGYGLVLLFTLVTLPVEFNASSRALAVLGARGIVDEDELPEVRRMLNAAALTYVASAVQVLLVVLYLLSLLARDRR